MNRLIDMLLTRSPRERGLLALLALVVVPVGLWFGVLEPLSKARISAGAQLAEAQALNAWIKDRVAEIDQLGTPTTGAPVAPIGSAALEQSLLEAQLRSSLSELINRAGGEVALRFDEVPFGAFAGWLSGAQQNWGYNIVAFRIEEVGKSGMVAANLTLRPIGGG